MLLNELTDTQVAGAFIDQNQQTRRADSVKTPQQLAREKGAQITADRTSKDPLKMRIAQLRQQLAILLTQDQKKTADAARAQGAQGAAPGQPVPTAGQPAAPFGAPAGPASAPQ